MAVIPPLRRLATEDFSGQSWADKLVSPLNSFMESVRAMFINGLTVSENMSGTVRTVELDGNFPVKFAWSLPSKPRTVLVGEIDVEPCEGRFRTALEEFGRYDKFRKRA